METYQQQQKNREKHVEKGTEGGGAKLRQENKEEHQPISPPTSPPSQTSPSSSSPSHEFSFTISLHSNNSSNTFTKNSKAPPSLAVDLSPADDIFFHGHLLPLHLLSHLPSSPRSSTNSMDSFTLPIRELLEDKNPYKDSGSCSTSNRSNITIDNNNNKDGTKGEGKSKPAFSLFGLTKGLKGSKVRDKEDKEKRKKKLKFDVIHALKKYLRMVQPLVLFKGKREKFRLHGKSSYSYSGNVTPRNKQEFMGWRGQYSAPASMRTSPTNSGLLVAATALPPASDSTMEELQAAIQAAIAHCKNSIAKEEKLKC